jgi:hypothetical protein
MSGPKVSKYDLSAWARKNLSQQIIYEHNTFVCIEQIKNLLQEISGMRGDILTATRNMEMLKERVGEETGFLDELHEMEQLFETRCSLISDSVVANAPAPSTAFIISDETLAAKKAIHSKIKEIYKETAEFRQEMDELILQVKKKSDEYTVKLENAILLEFEAGINEALPDIYVSNGEDVYTKLFSKIEAKLTAVCMDQAVPIEIFNDAKRALSSLNGIHDLDHLRIFEALSVNSLIKRRDEAAAARKVFESKYRELYTRYTYLSVSAGCEAKEIPLSDDAITVLQQRIMELEKALVKQAEQEYISDCVDAVMSEMGCDLLGKREVAKKSGKKFRNKLYYYNEGTAVNVTYASDGKITMELGGIDTADRIPDAGESELLCENMKSFCADFEEIEKKLLEKGVMVESRISLSPPSSDFASIININGYTSESKQPVATITASGRRKKAIVQKNMRKDDA